MRKLLFIFALLFLAIQAKAATTWNVNSGQSQSTIQGVINGASAGDTFIFAAGTYPVSSGYTIKCGITYTGPVVPAGTAPSVIMNSSMGTGSNIFNLHSTGSGGGYAAPCSQQTTIQYIYFQGSGGIWVEGSYTNLQVLHNIFGNYQGVNGNPGPGVTGIYYEGGEGSNTSQVLSNALFQWNQFGDQNSCTQALQDSSSANGDGFAGGCAGMQTWGSMQNVSILNNIITHVGEGIHIQCPFSNNCEPPSGAIINGLTVRFNDFSNWQRAAWEHQPQAETNVNLQYNTWHDPSVNTVGFTWGASMACCWDGVTAPYLNVTSNTMIFNRVKAGSNGGYGYEAGGYQAHYDNNLSEASVAWANGIAWGCGPNASNSNNTITGQFSGYIVAEFNPGTGCPSGKPDTQPAQQTGNITGSTNTSHTSQAPTITLNSATGTFTFTDPGFTSGSLPLGNTGIWYTLDGSNPAPASGTSQYIASGGTVTVTSTTTPKAVGMWGAINQVGNSAKYVPASSGIISTYPSNMGFTPSSIITGPTFTSGGGTPTASTPTFSPASGTTFTSTQAVTISDSTPGATIYYTTNGSTPTTGSTVYSGPVTVSATTTVQALAAAPNFLNSTVGSATYTLVTSGCQVPAGSTQSQIQTILNACGSGNIAHFAAGTYQITTPMNWPCGVSMSGPVVPFSRYTTGDGYVHWGYQPTAILNSTVGINNTPINFPVCNTPTTFQYLEVNGNQPNGGASGGNGGGAIFLASGNSSNITITKSYFHGNQVDTNNSCCGQNSAEIYVAGAGTNQGFPVQTNLTITWNRFGAAGDCSNVMNTFRYGGLDYNNNGGNCAAVFLVTSSTNLVEEYNVIYNQEEGLKFYEPNPNGGQVGCSNPSANQYCNTNSLVEFNDFSGIHRIGIEAQTTPNPMNFNYNSWHDPINPGYGSWVFSLPQYNGSGQSQTNIITNVIGNVMVENVAPPVLNGVSGTYVPPIEFWGNGLASYNLGQGNPLTCTVSYGYGNTPWTIANNIYQGNSSQGYACNEENQNTNPNPTFTNNTQTTTIAALTSVAGNISPSSQTFSGSLSWTISNPGLNRDVNTTEWCTMDGTNPVPGQGTALPYVSGTGATITGGGTTTVKCVGMWGAPNQPASYASGWGYVPSGITQATYSGNGIPTTATPTFSPASETFAGTISVAASTTTPGSTLFCTQDGSTPTTSSPVYTGPFTVSATTTLQCIATTPSFNQSGIGTGSYQLVAPPALTGCFQGNTTPFVNTLTVGGATVQQILQCQYSSTGETLQCSPTADKYGSVVSDWGSSNTAIIQVGALGGSGSLAPGQVQGVGASPPTAFVAAGATQGTGQPVVCSEWVFTVSAAAATPTFSPAAGSFNGSVTVTPSSTSPSPTLYCTQNGSTPTTSSPVFTAPYTFTQTSTLKCIATSSGLGTSTVGSATYTQSTVAPPTFTPASEHFSSPISVSVNTTPSSAVIRCTTDGSTPTLSSPVYSGAFPVSTTTTIQCIGVATGYQTSAVSQGVYTFSTSTPLTSCTMVASPSVTSLQVGAATTQMIGKCFYGSTGQTLTCSPGADANGNSITAWGSSNTAVLNLGLIGSASPGQASGVTAGSATATAIATGGNICTPYAFTVTGPTLTGVSIALKVPPGGTSVTIGTPIQACASMAYTGVSNTLVCGAGADLYGTTPFAWSSSVTGKATISTSGLVTGVSTGSTNVGVSAGAFTSSPLGLTILAPNNNVSITLDGVIFSGTVIQ